MIAVLETRNVDEAHIPRLSVSVLSSIGPIEWTAERLVHRKMIVGLSDANTQIRTGKLAKHLDIIEGIGTNWLR